MTDATEAAVLPMWPVGSSAEYIDARLEVARAERRLRDQIEEVAAARRRLPKGLLLRDYVFREGPRDLSQDEPVRETRLRDLFGGHDTLFVYHMMFHPDDDEACSMCSMWIDGLHGVSHHIARNTAFVVIGKAPLPKLRAWARRRGWDGLRVLSSYNTTFNADMHAERANGAQRPVVSVFVKEGDQVRHFYTLPANFLDDSQRGFDQLSPVWNVLDLLPGGRGAWYPDNEYPGRERG